MKHFLLYQWARNVAAVSDFRPPNMNEGSQNCDPTDAATPPLPLAKVIAEELGEGMQETAICHS